MLLQLGIALTCSVASFSFSPTKINPNESIIECEEEVADEDGCGKSHHEAKTRLCFEPKTKKIDEKGDGMSPASAITSLGDSDLNALLLPELEDLFPAENGMSFISPPRRDFKSLPKHEKTLRARKNLSIWLDNEEIENHEPTPDIFHGEKDRSQDGSRSKPQKKGKSSTKSIAVLRDRPGGGKHGSMELEDLERKRNCLDERDQNMLECSSFTDQHNAPDVNFANKRVDVTPDVTAELNNLRIAVAELREREGIIQGELLEYYGLEEQHSYVIELEKDLRKKVAEIEDLKLQVFTLERQKKEISEEATIIEGIKDELIMEAEEELRMKQAEIGDLNSRLYFLEWEMREKDATSDLQKELAEAKHKINELQRQIHTEMGRTQMQRLKEKVKALHGKDVNKCDQDIDIEKKLQAAKILEVEVVELRRRNKDLEHQKRELNMKLAAADSQINVLSRKTESDNIIAKVEAEAASLKRANEDLCKQVETLQSNRFSEVEEIVYLRWINACLRYELRSLQSLVEAKAPSLELNKSASPRSQEKAKQLILEYGRPREEQEDSAYDSTSSQPSVSSSCISSDGLRQEEHGQESCSKTSRIIKRLKSWGRSKDDAHIFLDAPSVEIKQEMAGLSGESSPLSSTENGLSPLESLILRNSSNAVEATACGAKASRKSNASAASSNFPQFSNTFTPTTVKSVGSCGSRSTFGRSKSSNVAASFELMSLAVASTELTERYPPFKDRHKLALEWEQSIKEKAEEVAASKRSEAISSLTATEVKKRSPRKSKPPPEPSPSSVTPCKPIEKPAMAVPLPPPQNGATPTPPPPPPPPLPGLKKSQPQNCSSIQRAPEVVQFYQSLMKRDVKKDSAVLPSAKADGNLTEIRNDMIGEIQNRSSHLLAIKADVETQGEFIQSLAKQVLAASYSNIDDIVAFVSWLDEELSFLVDERAVLKHFDWPEGKADAFREAAFEYQDLKKLEHEISSYKDDHHLHRDVALRKMLTLLEKVERSVYALLRTREKAIARYKEHSIPVYWILDSGIVGKIKQSSVKLAQKYMRRIIKELDCIGTASQKPTREFLLLQGVRFAFRVHQFAGGFDHDSMRTFEELRSSACKC